MLAYNKITMKIPAVMLFATLVMSCQSSYDLLYCNELLQLRSQVNQLAVQLSETRANLSKLTVDSGKSHVSFLAKYSASYTERASGIFIFDQVIFNHGNGYNPTRGIFTAPFSGVYVMTAQFFQRGTQIARMPIDMRVNSVPISRIAMETAHTEISGSTAIVTPLSVGDQVWMQPSLAEAFNFWGQFHTFFSGSLLYTN